MAKQKEKAKPASDKPKRTVGRPKAIESPDVLWELFTAYVKDAKTSPYLVHDFVGKDAHEVRKERERPLSLVGFECYLFERGIITDFSDYLENKQNRYKEFIPIIRTCKKLIERDQFEGATAGVYQQNIIARKLGLVGKKDIEQKAQVEVKTIDYSKLSDEALNEIAALGSTRPE